MTKSRPVLILALVATILLGGASTGSADNLRLVAGHVTQEIVEPSLWIGQLSVAFDTSNSVYLVTYSTYTDEIKGQWVGSDGVLRGVPFSLVTGKFPVVKFVPESGVFALNYLGGGKGKFAVLRYQATDSFAWVTAAPIDVNPQLWSVDAYHYSAYVPARGHHLVTWWDAIVNAGQSFVRTVKTDGTLGSVVTLTGNLADVFDSPEVACGANECLVVGKHYNDTTRRFGAWGRWLDLDGNPTGGTFFFEQNTDIHDMVGVAYSPAQNFYQVVWVRAGGFPEAVSVAPGAGTGFSKYSITPTYGGTRIAYNGGSNSFSVFLNGWNYDVFAHELSGAGAPIGGDVAVYQNNPGLLNTSTALATDPLLRRTLVAYKFGVTKNPPAAPRSRPVRRPAEHVRPRNLPGRNRRRHGDVESRRNRLRRRLRRELHERHGRELDGDAGQRLDVRRLDRRRRLHRRQRDHERRAELCRDVQPGGRRVVRASRVGRRGGQRDGDVEPGGNQLRQ